MTGKTVTCRIDTCPPFEELVRALLTPDHRQILEEYRSIVEQDRDYLTYHWMSTALKLQFLLKRDDIPEISIGGCIDGVASGCCVVEALREAMLRGSRGPGSEM